MHFGAGEQSPRGRSSWPRSSAPVERCSPSVTVRVLRWGRPLEAPPLGQAAAQDRARCVLFIFGHTLCETTGTLWLSVWCRRRVHLW